MVTNEEVNKEGFHRCNEVPQGEKNRRTLIFTLEVATMPRRFGIGVNSCGLCFLAWLVEDTSTLWDIEHILTKRLHKLSTGYEIEGCLLCQQTPFKAKTSKNCSPNGHDMRVIWLSCATSAQREHFESMPENKTAESLPKLKPLCALLQART